MNLVPLPLQWTPLPAGIADQVTLHMRGVLEKWNKTPYMPGQRCRGVGVDCVRFVVGFLSDMERRECPPDFKIPQDASMHDKQRSFGALRFFLEAWPDHQTIHLSAPVEPGDILVVGPPEGGPGHAIIVGPERGTLWHTSSIGVARQGWFLYSPMTRVFRVYRHTNRKLWI